MSVTLTSASGQNLWQILGAVPELADDGAARRDVSMALTTCLREPDGRLALRPDAVADQLVIDTLADRPTLPADVLAAHGDPLTVLAALNRAGGADQTAAGEAIRALVASDLELLRPALAVAVTQGGPALAALEAIAANPRLEVPEAFDEAVPADDLFMHRLGWLLAERRVREAQRNAATTPERLAEALLAAAEAARLASTPESGRQYAEQAVQLLRLADAHSAEHQRALAIAAGILANQLAALGERDSALSSAREAVTAFRTLVPEGTDPAAPERVLPLTDLATSLNNLSNRLGDAGDREAALEAIREAVQLYRALAAARTDAFTPDLAGSLNNLSNRLGDAGDREAALEAIREAVQLYRALAAARPDAFTPDLAARSTTSPTGSAMRGIARRRSRRSAKPSSSTGRSPPTTRRVHPQPRQLPEQPMHADTRAPRSRRRGARRCHHHRRSP